MYKTRLQEPKVRGVLQNRENLKDQKNPIFLKNRIFHTVTSFLLFCVTQTHKINLNIALFALNNKLQLLRSQFAINIGASMKHD